TDDTQAALLKERALREIEGEFLEEKDVNFRHFYDNFAGDRVADSPRDLLLELYDFAMAKPEYRSWLINLDDVYVVNGSIVESYLLKKQIKPYFITSIGDLQEKINDYLKTPVLETKVLAKVMDAFTLFATNLDHFVFAL